MKKQCFTIYAVWVIKLKTPVLFKNNGKLQDLKEDFLNYKKFVKVVKNEINNISIRIFYSNFKVFTQH